MNLQGVAEVKKNLDRFGEDTIRKIAAGIGAAISEGENTAKHQAPWTDRTGNARNSITGTKPEISNDVISASLFIGMDYGKFLELCHYGRYRIIWPTLEWLTTRMNLYLSL